MDMNRSHLASFSLSLFFFLFFLFLSQLSTGYYEFIENFKALCQDRYDDL